jgi:hypothetical protein
MGYKVLGVPVAEVALEDRAQTITVKMAVLVA